MSGSYNAKFNMWSLQTSSNIEIAKLKRLNVCLGFAYIVILLSPFYVYGPNTY